MKELNPLIHSQLRLSILSILMSVEEADFMYLKTKTEATMGNLSVQITKLEEAGYITVEKTFHQKRPRTVCRMTEGGREAFIEYVGILKSYVAPYIDSADANVSGSATIDGPVMC
ncbi:MAG: transcriptional regulator [Staphylococcus sp.]|nr:transcriptional regulator [Staphylococcus sp.]